MRNVFSRRRSTSASPLATSPTSKSVGAPGPTTPARSSPFQFLSGRGSISTSGQHEKEDAQQGKPPIVKAPSRRKSIAVGVFRSARSLSPQVRRGSGGKVPKEEYSPHSASQPREDLHLAHADNGAGANGQESPSLQPHAFVSEPIMEKQSAAPVNSIGSESGGTVCSPRSFCSADGSIRLSRHVAEIDVPVQRPRGLFARPAGRPAAATEQQHAAAAAAAHSSPSAVFSSFNSTRSLESVSMPQEDFYSHIEGILVGEGSKVDPESQTNSLQSLETEESCIRGLGEEMLRHKSNLDLSEERFHALVELCRAALTAALAAGDHDTAHLLLAASGMHGQRSGNVVRHGLRGVSGLGDARLWLWVLEYSVAFEVTYWKQFGGVASAALGLSRDALIKISLVNRARGLVGSMLHLGLSRGVIFEFSRALTSKFDTLLTADNLLGGPDAGGFMWLLELLCTAEVGEHVIGDLIELAGLPCGQRTDVFMHGCHSRSLGFSMVQELLRIIVRAYSEGWRRDYVSVDSARQLLGNKVQSTVDAREYFTARPVGKDDSYHIRRCACGDEIEPWLLLGAHDLPWSPSLPRLICEVCYRTMSQRVSRVVDQRGRRVSPDSFEQGIQRVGAAVACCEQSTPPVSAESFLGVKQVCAVGWQGLPEPAPRKANPSSNWSTWGNPFNLKSLRENDISRFVKAMSGGVKASEHVPDRRPRHHILHLNSTADGLWWNYGGALQEMALWEVSEIRARGPEAASTAIALICAHRTIVVEAACSATYEKLMRGFVLTVFKLRGGLQ
jgi:hypothetical protein